MEHRLSYANMPVDLVLVRHGESEGNLAQRLYRDGAVDLWTREFRGRHNSKYRLTDRGRWQATQAGNWIKKCIGDKFDLYLTSEYVRAMETAAYLDLPDAMWRTDIFLRERDRGVLANRPKSERVTHFPDEIEREERDSFYFQPTGGESIANCCLRVETVIKFLQKSHSGMRVIAVCHGGIIKAFRALIERKRQIDFRYGFDDICDAVNGSPKNQARSDSSSVYKILNGMIIHYTRRDINTGLIRDSYNYVRQFCPWTPHAFSAEWTYFEPPTMSNSQLLDEVEKVHQLVNEAYPADIPQDSLIVSVTN